MNEKERKELLERIVNEFGLASGVHYEEPDCWGYIDADVDTEERIRIVIKDDYISIGLRFFYYTGTGWKRKFKQNLKSLLRCIKERKIKEMENRKKEIQNCGTAYEC
jgi:hypothetical protein